MSRTSATEARLEEAGREEETARLVRQDLKEAFSAPAALWLCRNRTQPHPTVSTPLPSLLSSLAPIPLSSHLLSENWPTFGAAGTYRLRFQIWG